MEKMSTWKGRVFSWLCQWAVSRPYQTNLFPASVLVLCLVFVRCSLSLLFYICIYLSLFVLGVWRAISSSFFTPCSSPPKAKQHMVLPFLIHDPPRINYTHDRFILVYFSFRGVYGLTYVFINVAVSCFLFSPSSPAFPSSLTPPPSLHTTCHHTQHTVVL